MRSRLRIAANGALATDRRAPATAAQRSITIAPGVAQSFELENVEGDPICSAGDVGETGELPDRAAGVIKVHIAPTSTRWRSASESSAEWRRR